MWSKVKTLLRSAKARIDEALMTAIGAALAGVIKLRPGSAGNHAYLAAGSSSTLIESGGNV